LAAALLIAVTMPQGDPEEQVLPVREGDAKRCAAKAGAAEASARNTDAAIAKATSRHRGGRPVGTRPP
jgi:hypothetical protein